MQSPGGTREDVAKTLGIPEDNVTVNVTLLGGGFGRKSKCDFALEAALLSKAIDGAGEGALDARGRHPSRLLPHRLGRAARGRARQSGKAIAWRHRSVAPTIVSTFAAGAEARGALRARHGPRRHAVRDPQHPLREPGSRGAHAHRLVPFGLEHPARLCGAVVRRRDRAGGRARPEGLPARADRPVRASSSRR